ncbi:hypothetical protein [Aneurinibacillus aneurinilyticus]|uniref:Uncharacterized protein n=2 Tax=Aneurinibacillus aneurinilyticus TaxID=1391 RepID=A0A848CK83_ANEAE|nr:hypothetical protein [Aneurinibacillus aneurinilyticus]ERI08237.1 hypothetical protein HMPREF0083_03718 [Aneurinibacillus aneurinilyticus ATCC 12856]MCI1695136.1 hypothetical protein [Aneurinibacillus aneurinilyticus]MED0670470.1 hypothetical protein [Aneurinibacillus aneurinilyticus]MED0704602.1 hypothetical protein [Aneurinibacillus aneurinilyticus]MED0721534.1 hypothetical protein [Aneurinibacillus aneurinilyticus]
MDKYRQRKEKRKGGRSLVWAAFAFLYIVIIYILLYFIKVPVDYTKRIGLEAGLFFLSVIFLDAYLQAFTTISIRPVQKVEAHMTRPNPIIIAFWVISLCYHLSIGLLSSMYLPDWMYYMGFVFTLALFIATVIHFLAYFAYSKRERQWVMEERYASDQRRAYEIIRDSQSQYYWIRDVMKNNEEVRQMMLWNNFDRNLEERMYELQPYFQRTIFTNKDLDKIAGISAWLDNMRRIIEEHPNYSPVQACSEELPLRSKRRQDE